MRFKTAPEPARLWFLGPRSRRLRVGVWGCRVLGVGAVRVFGFRVQGGRCGGLGLRVCKKAGDYGYEKFYTAEYRWLRNRHVVTEFRV